MKELRLTVELNDASFIDDPAQALVFKLQKIGPNRGFASIRSIASLFGLVYLL